MRLSECLLESKAAKIGIQLPHNSFFSSSISFLDPKQLLYLFDFKEPLLILMVLVISSYMLSFFVGLLLYLKPLAFFPAMKQ